MKKLFCAILAVIICFTVSATALAHHGYENFKNRRDYGDRFHDVKEESWHHTYVKQAYERGLMTGKSGDGFAPDDSLTVAEAITLAARLHCLYTTGGEIDAAVSEGGSWYDPYVAYALENGIITEAYQDYDAAAKRCDVAVIFACALPEGAFEQLRNVDDDAIPDVPASAGCGKAVYKLYRAGIFSGNDEYGTFAPDSEIKRSEIAAVCVRIADPSQRDGRSLEKHHGENEKNGHHG